MICAHSGLGRKRDTIEKNSVQWIHQATSHTHNKFPLCAVFQDLILKHCLSRDFSQYNFLCSLVGRERLVLENLFKIIVLRAQIEIVCLLPRYTKYFNLMYFVDSPLKWLCAHSARVLELGSQSSSLWYHAWEPSIGIFIGSQFHCHFVCVQAAIFVHGGLMLLYFICCKYLAHNDKKCYYVLSYTSKL